MSAIPNLAHVYTPMPPYRIPKGVKAPLVQLIRPHESEKPSVDPFLRTLAGKLRSEGIMVDGKEVNGREKGWNLRSYTYTERASSELWQIPPKIINSAMQDVLSLDDFLVRARLALSAVQRGNTFVLEIHATDHTLEDDSNGRSLNGTDIFVMDFQRTLGEALKSFNDRVVIMSRRLSKVLGFDFDKGLKELEDLERSLGIYGDVVKSVEIPTRMRFYEEGEISRLLYRLYYRRSPYSNLITEPEVSSFENRYCTQISCPVEFNGGDLSAVSSILVMPEYRSRADKIETPS